ncbi:hypothetical protein [Streptomyces sp. M-16]|uniref:hypothetical protein n=1 Tax=Streptomyces sp. M-16 TaxID=3233040 RepID=UPI003F9D7B63
MVSEAALFLKEEFRDRRLGMSEQTRRLGDTAKAGSLRAGDLMTTPAVTIRRARMPGAAPSALLRV